MEMDWKVCCGDQLVHGLCRCVMLVLRSRLIAHVSPTSDVAISAPFASGGGKVFIYNGVVATTISSTHSQVNY